MTEKAQPPVCAGPQTDIVKPSFAMPPGATDSHAHVFGPRAHYGYADDRQYTPPPVFLKDYLAMHDVVGFARGVVVQSGFTAPTTASSSMPSRNPAGACAVWRCCAKT